MNNLFGTSFDEAASAALPGDAGRRRALCEASVSSTQPNVLVLGATCRGAAASGTNTVALAGVRAEAAASGAVTGGPAEVLALHATLADVALLHVWESDLGRAVPTNRAALRALLAAQSSSGGARLLVVVVHDAPVDGGTNLEAAVRAEVEAAWSDLRDGRSLEDVVKLQVHGVPDASHCTSEQHTASVAALQSTVQALVANAPGSLAAANGAGAVAEQVRRTWAGAASALPLPSSDELKAICQVDEVYAQAVAAAEPTVHKWLGALRRGGGMPNFGSDAVDTMNRVLGNFDAQTRGALRAGLAAAASHRGVQRRRLVRWLNSEAVATHAGLLAELESATTQKVEQQLLGLVKQLKDPSGPLDDAKADALVRDAVLQYAAAASKLAVPGVCGSEGGTQEATAMAATLGELLQSFGESNANKVLRMNRLQRQMERSKKTPKNPRAIVPNFHLAGLVRQVGSGNLSGFAGYALGAFGGSHTINVGYANDRGAPEDGDDSPLLRLQPKVHFDVDL